MSAREFVDPEGHRWYVSEAFDGTGLRLQFDRRDETRVFYGDPPAQLDELPHDELLELFSQAERTWSRNR